MRVIESLLADLLYAGRVLAKSPGFTLTAVLSLALGIGSSTLIFSVINAVLLRPLPYKDSGHLVWIWSSNPASPIKQRASYPDFLDWKSQNQTFESIVGWGGYEVVLTGIGEPERLQAGLTSGNLFEVLGVAPLLGSTATSTGSDPNELRVVISHRLWQRQFNAESDVIGRRVTLNGQSQVIVGVTPAGFEFPIQTARPVDFWMELATFNPILRDRRDARLIEVIGRLRPGVTLREAQADMDVLAARLQAQYPATNRNMGIRLVSALDEATGNASRGLLTLFAAVAVLLLIACVNVANLMMTRATGQRKEIAIRAALGAGRGRIALQFCIQSLLLAAGGGILGIVVADSSTDMLRAWVPADLPRRSEITIDANVLGFTLLAAFVSWILFGMASAWHASSKSHFINSLSEAGFTISDGRTGRRLTRTLVVAEIALAMILLSSAGLFANSLWRLLRSAPGLDAQNVLTFELNWRPDGSLQPAAKFLELQKQLQAIPGIVAVSTGLQFPDRGSPLINDISPFFEVEGRPVPSAERARLSVIHTQPGYFRAMGIPLLKGRDFDLGDIVGSSRVVIINESLARTYFPNEEPIGKRLKLNSWRLFGPQTLEIVAVSGNVTHVGLSAPSPLIYVPFAQAPRQGSQVVMKTQGNPLSYVSTVRAAVASIDKDQPVEDFQTLEQRIAGTLAKDRFTTLSLGMFSVLAVLLAAIGLYGVLSYATARRTQEIAIRVALGAEKREVVRLVLNQGMTLAVVGILAGLAGALALTRLIEGLLFGITANDPWTLIAVSLLMALIAMLACWIPARRAMKMDAIAALRHQ